MRKVVSDQADGLRRLMASSPGRLVALVGSETAVGMERVSANLKAALVQQGHDVLLLDEHKGLNPPNLQRDARLVLINAALDGDGALSAVAAKADDILVVLQANAASIMQAYACIKRLHYAHALQRVRILVNQVTDAGEAQRILSNLAHTGSRYLAVALEPAGWVRADPLMLQAQRLNLTVVEAFQSSPAASDFRQIAFDLLQWPYLPVDGRDPSRRPSAVAGQEAHSALGMH
ncbi:MinD/ParA family protein [Polaromonas sp. UC242_47]|uniref:MinD/ParA family protein n=1 Tax=Polaromonas sp. UC242_47 TaxID=3374626 RepID=UPI00379BCA1B